jgi:uncharacterized protein YndB with AHSA1/START domain
MQEDREVRETLEVEADRAEVWRAWTEPARLRGWMAERAEGTMVPGGRVLFGWDSLGLELELAVIDLEPGRRLVVRGGAPGRPPRTQSVELEPIAGGTRITLGHAGFPPGAAGDGERAGTAAGWHVMLRVLAHYLAGRTGRERAFASAIAPVAAPLRRVGELLHDRAARAAWLTDGDGPDLVEGERFALRTGGATIGGRVIAAAPPFELALGWDDIDGVVVLRAIQVAAGPAADGAAPLLAVAQAWTWSPGRPAWARVPELLEEVIARLARAAGGPTGAAA